MSAIELNEKMKEEVSVVLEKHMPKFVCGVVKERLEKADEMERELLDSTETIDRQEEELRKLKALNHKANELDDRIKELEAKEYQLEQDRARFERDKRVHELEHKLEAKNAIIQHTKEVNLNLTKNVVRRRELMRGESIVIPPHEDMYGNQKAAEVRSDTHFDTETEHTQLED